MGDFTTDPGRLAVMSLLGALVGMAAAFVAKALLALIGFITNLVYFGQIGDRLTQPDPSHWGPISIFIPIAGALIVGLIARYGTDKIRGHGIPEAIQSILNRDSIIQGRVAIYKPIASAITIGTGSPFGAEGPIIMTGGALGSLFAQYLRLSSMERRTLLVCGASAGMAATFGAPIASVMIAIELLLFEWKPRSFIPVVVASFIAYAVRTAIIGTAPPFLIAHPESLDVPDYAFAVLVGIGGGIVSALMTKLVYFLEDTYERLPVHWMWWPALGAVVVGIGGWFVPAALGVGYGTINGMLNGHLALDIVLGIIIVKIVIWSTALSSGTSGGVLAPLLMIGAATGTLFAAAIPGHQSGAWAAIGMAAVMGGTMRAPFMATLFTIETTHAWVLLPPVFVGCMAATAFTVVFVPRSILTEKLARRGTHVSREYSVHPLELIAVERVMEPRTDAAARPQLSIAASERVRSAATLMAESDERELAVVDDSGEWIGTVTLDHLLRAWRLGLQSETQRVRVRKLRFLSAAWRR